MKKPPRRKRRGGFVQTATKAFVWVVLAIFVFTSVGVALVTFR